MDKGNMVFTYTVEYYSVIANNESLSFAAKWIKLGGIMLSKIN
jgi:hypothetical protein